jgi:hypothetical protein
VIESKRVLPDTLGLVAKAVALTVFWTVFRLIAAPLVGIKNLIVGVDNESFYS